MNWIKKAFSGNAKEETIRSLEKTYNVLKSNNHDKDEHWLLINAWLSRYKDWEASRQKGPKLMKCIAFKDTFQFSLLDPPKSIKALSLFLVYKELSDKEAESGAGEFAQLIEPIEQMREEHRLIEEYRQRNPFTYREAVEENDNSIYGVYGFLKSVEYLDDHPEEEATVMSEVENL